VIPSVTGTAALPQRSLAHSRLAELALLPATIDLFPDPEGNLDWCPGRSSKPFGGC